MLWVLLLFFPCAFGTLSSGITGFNGFNGSFFVDGVPWQGWMDGNQRFFLALNNIVYRWDFGTGNLITPVHAADANPPNGLQKACSFGSRGTLAYRVPGRLFMQSVYQQTTYEIDMDTLQCTPITSIPGSSSCFGLAVDPTTKDLYATSSANDIWRIIPNATKNGIATSSKYATGSGLAVDGLTIGPDGTMYFAAGSSRVGILHPGSTVIDVSHVIKYNGQFYSPDGMAVSSDGQTLLINTNQGYLLLVDLTNSSWPISVAVFIGSGVYGDVGQVGADGCPYFSELNFGFMFKVTPCIFSAGANHVPDVCSTDSDCTSGNCTNGHCAVVDIPHKCEVNSDCSSQYCFNRTCQLAPVTYPCTDNKFCSSNNCLSGNCSKNSVPGTCHADSDCFSNNCNEGLNVCAATTPLNPCAINADCTSNSCSNGTCQYVDVGQFCTSDIDCTSSNCTNHVCVVVPPTHSCQKSNDCTTHNCTSWTCQSSLVNQYCTFDTDCTSGDCDIVNHVCLAVNAGQGCKYDSDCTSGHCPLVENPPRICTASPVNDHCAVPNDCTSRNCTAGFCKPTHVTMHCDENADCTSNNCDTVNHVCKPVPPTSACVEDNDCTTVSCVNGTCKTVPVNHACTYHTDCTSGNCTNSKCIVVPVGHACQLNDDCTTKNCTGGACTISYPGYSCVTNVDCTSLNCVAGSCVKNPVGFGCQGGFDCNSNTCDPATHKCVAADLGGQCLADTDCKPPTVCADRRCKMPVTLTIVNLPQVDGQDNVWALPSEPGSTISHDIQIQVTNVKTITQQPTGGVKFTELNPTPGPVGTVGQVQSNIATVTLPWNAKAKLGVHNIQVQYSGDGLHFGKNWTTNIVYFYFPTEGRFSISMTVKVDTSAYFYGAQWKTKNFGFHADETDTANYVGYRGPSVVTNNNMKCNFAQSVGQMADHTLPVAYAWLGVPMLNATDDRGATGTARGTNKFGIVKVNPDCLPLPDTGVNGQPASNGVGNLYGTFCISAPPFLR